MDTPTIISVFAFLLSGYAIWNTQRFRKQQLAFQKQNAQDATKAKMVAFCIPEKTPTGKVGYKVEICNQGTADARNVQIELPENDSWGLSTGVEQKFPMKVIQPQQKIYLNAAIYFGCDPKETIILRWEDDFKSNNERKIDLTF